MYAIGLISGTSADGIDAALVHLRGTEADLEIDLVAGSTYPDPPALRARVLATCAGEPLSVENLAALDDAIAAAFAAAARKLQTGQPPAQLIGSHGQTVFHRPPTADTLGYSLQLGRGDAIARLTGTRTIANFRAADIAAGGHGAPLVSKLDACLLGHPSEPRCVQNLGGIGNFTYLPPTSDPDWQQQICGWDTGPGNALLDLAIAASSGGRLTYDADGAEAAKGTTDRALLAELLEHPFFAQAPPKSTGRETFGAGWLAHYRDRAARLAPADWLATLTDFTAHSVARSYRDLPRPPATVLLCGGGRHNRTLVARLQTLLPASTVTSVDRAGLDGDLKEAIAFAVLAYWRELGIPGNLPQVTGARVALPLGEVHLPGLGGNASHRPSGS